MNKETWIDEVLQSAKTIMPVEGNPFLYTRVLAQLQKGRPAPRLQPGWVYVLSTVMVIAVVMNLYAWFNMPATVPEPGSIQGVVQEYGWSVGDAYSINYSK